MNLEGNFLKNFFCNVFFCNIDNISFAFIAIAILLSGFILFNFENAFLIHKLCAFIKNFIAKTKNSSITSPLLNLSINHKKFLSLIFALSISICALVLSDNLITFFIFWEAISILGYFLVGFNENAQRAATIGLITNMIGSTFMLTAILLLNYHGIFSFSDMIFSNTNKPIPLYLDNIISIFIAISIITKSAQFPFSFWLFKSIQARAEVSAYLHSCTLIKAGVYLVLRLLNYNICHNLPHIIIAISIISIIFNSIKAFFSHKIKELLAITTLNQVAIFLIATSYAKYFHISDNNLENTLLTTNIFNNNNAIFPQFMIDAILIAIILHAVYKFCFFIMTNNKNFLDIQNISITFGEKIFFLFIIGLSLGLPFLQGTKAIWNIFYNTNVIKFFTIHVMAFNCSIFITIFAMSNKQNLHKFARFLSNTSILNLKNLSLKNCDPRKNNSTIIMFALTFITLFILKTLFKHIEKNLLYLNPNFIDYSSFYFAILLFSTLLIKNLTQKNSKSLLYKIKILCCKIATQNVANSRINTLIKYIKNFGIFFQKKVLSKIHQTSSQIKSQNKTFILISIVFSFVLAISILLSTISNISYTFYYDFIIKCTHIDWTNIPILICCLISISGIFMLIKISKSVMQFDQQIFMLIYTNLVGIGVGGIYVFWGALDVGITHFLCETISSTFMIILIKKLNNNSDIQHKSTNIRRIIANTAGIMTFCILITIFLPIHQLQFFNNLINEYIELSQNNNIVALIITDFRGFDTWGEMTVLGLASLIILSITNHKNSHIKTLIIPQQTFLHNQIHNRISNNSSIIKNILTKIIKYLHKYKATLNNNCEYFPFHKMINLVMLSFCIIGLWQLINGHSIPGGGFITGLIIALSITLFQIKNFQTKSLIATTKFHINTHHITNIFLMSLVISLISASLPLLYSKPFFTSTLGKFPLAIFFDCGIMFSVISLIGALNNAIFYSRSHF